MPEGPEIRREADRIAKVLEGHVARKVRFAFDDLRGWQRRLQGRTIRAVEPRGKALLTRFDGGVQIYSHNQLYGRWYVTRTGSTPATHRSLRLAVHTDAGTAWLYSASDIEVLRDAELDAHPYLAKLGPDVLDRDVRPEHVLARLQDDRFARRGLGGLLLDQGFLGGIGNYLRSEILFVAGIDPGRRPADLDDGERRALARAALGVSRRAYRTRGITTDATLARRLRDEGWPRRAYRHLVFGRDGEPCHRCGTDVERRTVAGRRLYACSTCQH
jgi:endonuclease-8